MKVQEKYYRLLKSGQKTVELRLYDEKRKNIKVGDELTFENLSDPTDFFIGVVTHLYRAGDFKELSETVSPLVAGFQSKEDLVQTMATFYPLERQKAEGVLGIEIKIKK